MVFARSRVIFFCRRCFPRLKRDGPSIVSKRRVENKNEKTARASVFKPKVKMQFRPIRTVLTNGLATVKHAHRLGTDGMVV